MSNNASVQSLVSQAILGTDRTVLNEDILPENLQQALGDIKDQSVDIEEAFFKAANLTLSSFQLDSFLSTNSFSIEQINHYQQLQEELSQATDKKGAATTTKNVQDADPLIAQIKMHVGPVPLIPISDEALPVFPSKISQLCSLLINGERINLFLTYWFLNKLSAYPMQLDAKAGAMIFNLLEQGRFGASNNYTELSDYMVYDELFKVGGESIRYSVSVLSGNKTLKDLVEERRRVALSGDAHAQMDYAALLRNAPTKDALDIFALLRKSDPAKAREIIEERLSRFSSENRLKFINLFEIGLSADDEPLLINILKTDTSVNCRQAAFDILGLLPNSQLSKGCVEWCAKILRFENNRWQIEKVLFTQELKDIGLSSDLAKLRKEDQPQAILQQLLKGMSWTDFKTIAQTDNDVEALKRWKLLIECGDDKKVNRFWDAIIAHKLSLTGDSALAEAFFEVFDKKSTWSVQHDRLAINLNIDKRIKLLRYSDSFSLNFSYFFVEKDSSLLDFKQLDNKWATAVLDWLLHHRDYTHRQLHDVFCGMFFSYDMIDVCEQKIQAVKDQLQKIPELEAKINPADPQKEKNRKLYEIRRKAYQYQAEIHLLEFVLDMLRSRQKIEETIADVLGPAQV